MSEPYLSILPPSLPLSPHPSHESQIYALYELQAIRMQEPSSLRERRRRINPRISLNESTDASVHEYLESLDYDQYDYDYEIEEEEELEETDSESGTDMAQENLSLPLPHPPKPLPRMDPSSSTSPSTFLLPGVIFNGSQIFVPTPRLTRLARPTRPMRQNYEPPPLYPPSLAHPSFPHTFSQSSTLLTARTPSMDFTAARARLMNQANGRSSSEARLLAATRRRWLASDAFTSTILNPDDDDDDDDHEDDREREEGEGRSMGQRLELAARRAESSRELYEAVRSEAMSLLNDWDGETKEEEEGEGELEMKVDDDAENSDERWGVQVIIQDVDSEKLTLSGLMHATNVPSQPSSSTTPVTTFFRGSIVNPQRPSSLWAPKEWGGKQRDECTFWEKLSPFKASKVGGGGGMLKRLWEDEEWLERTLQGWVLMRWKEVEFVNITPDESSLSISGWYLVALDRATGAIEGVYYDPSASPYQRLVLTPSNGGSSFSLGSFEFR